MNFIFMQLIQSNLSKPNIISSVEKFFEKVNQYETEYYKQYCDIQYTYAKNVHVKQKKYDAFKKEEMESTMLVANKIEHLQRDVLKNLKNISDPKTIHNIMDDYINNQDDLVDKITERRDKLSVQYLTASTQVKPERIEKFETEYNNAMDVLNKSHFQKMKGAENELKALLPSEPLISTFKSNSISQDHSTIKFDFAPYTSQISQHFQNHQQMLSQQFTLHRSSNSAFQPYQRSSNQEEKKSQTR